MAAVQNRGRRHKWAIDFSHRRGDRQIQPTSDLPSPVGYTDKTVTDVSARDKDSSLVAKRAWDVALGPLKQFHPCLYFLHREPGMWSWVPCNSFIHVCIFSTESFECGPGSPETVSSMFVFSPQRALNVDLGPLKQFHPCLYFLHREPRTWPWVP
ncbi:ER membrane protein complex subunit 4-like isoform X2 [Branchiostoma floridae x Branchiostoma japonicum]